MAPPSPLETRVDLLWHIGEQIERRGSYTLNISLELPDAARYHAFEYLKKKELISTMEERSRFTDQLIAECRLTGRGRMVYQQIEQGYRTLISSLVSELSE